MRTWASEVSLGVPSSLVMIQSAPPVLVMPAAHQGQSLGFGFGSGVRQRKFLNPFGTTCHDPVVTLFQGNAGALQAKTLPPCDSAAPLASSQRSELPPHFFNAASKQCSPCATMNSAARQAGGTGEAMSGRLGFQQVVRDGDCAHSVQVLAACSAHSNISRV